METLVDAGEEPAAHGMPGPVANTNTLRMRSMHADEGQCKEEDDADAFHESAP
jgi:hypothetical protein